MKVIKRMVIPILLVVMLCSIGLLFVGCEEEEKEPVFEIKLYDDNWVELEKRGREGYISITREYDGTPQGCNAKCFMDGEVFFTYEYKLKKQPYDLPLDIMIKIVEGPGEPNEIVSKIVEKGKYDYQISFLVAFEPNHIYETEFGRGLCRKDLPTNICHSFMIYVI